MLRSRAVDGENIIITKSGESANDTSEVDCK